MVRVVLIIALALGMSHLSQAQNLLPNPGFEIHSSCPGGLGQVNGYVSSWNRANTASPDYGNCGFSGNSAIRFTPRTGSGVIGMWGGASHPSCASTAYSEAISANLTSPMTAGQVYDVSIAVRVDGIGTSTSTPNNCVNFGMYFYNSATPPAQNGWCCFSVTPQWSIPGGSILDGVYTMFTGTITATGNFNRVIIGPFCNATTGSASCNTYATARMYFNLDDVAAQQSVVLDEGSLALFGESYSGFHALSWEMAEGLGIEAFQLERGSDGERFQVIHEVQAGEAQRLFAYRDDAPMEGDNYYRVRAIDSEGRSFFSNAKLLRHGILSPDGQQFNFRYDPIAGEIAFVLEDRPADNYQLELIDLNGRVLGSESFSQTAGEQSFRKDISGLSRGIYLLRLRSLSQGGAWQGKFVHP